MSQTLWILYDAGGRDDPAEVYGVFTSEEKAKRAAAHCDPRGYTSIDSVLVDALYKTEGEVGGSSNVFSYPQPEPDVTWDRMVVDGGSDRPARRLDRGTVGRSSLGHAV
jgi:hypothetical protein